MNFNGDIAGDFTDGGIMMGSLEITDDLTVGDSITLEGKYTLPITAPVGANNVIVSDGSDQLVWTGDLSVGDVSSITTSTLDGEIVLFNGTGGKSVKNSAALLSSFITNPLDRTSNDAAASEISVRKAHGVGGYVQDGDQISRYSSSAFRQLGSIYAYTGWHQWEATEDHLNSSGCKYSVWTTDNGQTLPVRKLEIDSNGISVLDTLRVKSGVVSIDGAVNAAIMLSRSSVTKWQVGAIGGDDFKIANPTTLNTPLLIDSVTDKVTLEGKMLVGDDVNIEGSLFTDKIYIGQDVNNWRIEPLGANLALDFFDELNERQLILGKGDIKPYRNTNDALPCFFQFRKRRGNTETLSDAVLSGDGLLKIVGSGFKGPLGGFGENAGIEMNATENYTPTTSGSNIIFSTTSNGTTARLERMRIEESGSVVINSGTDSFALPQNRGVDRQVLTTDGAGLATWANLPHTFLGEIYTSNSAAQTIISNIGQYVPVAGAFIQSYNQGFLAATAPIFTYTGVGTRIFKVDSSFSFGSATGGTGITWSFALFRNGALLPGSIVEHRTTGTTDIGSDTITNLVTLANGDFVAVRVANLSSTVNCIVKHLSYNIIGLT